MALKHRLKRIESALPKPIRWSVFDFLSGLPVPDGFDPFRDLAPRHLEIWHLFVTLPNWLAERGYANALAAVEAGETGPDGLELLVQQQAAVDRMHREWQVFEREVAVVTLLPDARIG